MSDAALATAEPVPEVLAAPSPVPRPRRRILLTGAAGMLGSDLATVLAGAGHEVFARPRSDLDITRASNNYGPYQHPEKLIPLFITNAIDGLPLPLYGDGKNVRDWLSVEDHAAAIEFLLDAGEPGETYNVAGGNEAENLEITKTVLARLGRPESLIRFVNDRPGHDRRYSLDAGKLATLGFRPATPLDRGLAETIAWYRDHEDWWRPIKEKDAAYRAFYRTQYDERLATSSATAKEPG